MENWKFWFFWFFWSKTLKTHQIDGFRSRGPSKNARGYRFHAYKWSNHHITSIFDIVFMFSLIFECKSFNLLCLRRPKSIFLVIFRLQNRNFIFFYIAATALSYIPCFRAWNLVQIPLKIIKIGPLSAALWRFEVSIRISVPMLYITFLYIFRPSSSVVLDSFCKSPFVFFSVVLQTCPA